MKPSRPALLCLVTLLLCACSESRTPCNEGAARCEGDVLVACGTDQESPELFEKDYDCSEVGMHCVVPSSQDPYAHPLCAVSADPLPACDGRYNACEGTIFVSCNWGFPTSRQDCASDGRVCVDTSPYFSNCALSSTPDPRCDGSHAACEGDTVVVCEKGYAIQQKDCPGCHLKSSGAFDSSEHNCE